MKMDPLWSLANQLTVILDSTSPLSRDSSVEELPSSLRLWSLLSPQLQAMSVSFSFLSSSQLNWQMIVVAKIDPKLALPTSVINFTTKQIAGFFLVMIHQQAREVTLLCNSPPHL